MRGEVVLIGSFSRVGFETSFSGVSIDYHAGERMTELARTASGNVRERKRHFVKNMPFLT
jgi:hypothetical protein